MPSPPNQVVWTVSALNHEVKTLLERGIGRLWLEGELSNLSKPASGHWYFSLKDQHAQIRVAMFKSKNNRVAFTAANGQQVLIKASVSLYEARGEFQVIAEHMEEAGTGKLMREFEALKAKLKTEGLFDPVFKQTIPRYPRKIGIITSPTGAAIRDALSVLQRRCPATDVLVYPCVVQGENATQSIIQALGHALERHECDVLLMIRGGGSIEDMWCFNDEQLAHLIHQSCIPVITGIGHEIDFTIADFVADFRAPTPSVAAESASIDNTELNQQFDYLSTRLKQSVQHTLNQAHSTLTEAQQRLLAQHPIQAFNALKHRLDMLNIRLKQLIELYIEHLNQMIQHLQYRLLASNPAPYIHNLKTNIDAQKYLLLRSIKQQQSKKAQYLALHAQKLDALSPLKTLARGFAAISSNQQPVYSVQQVTINDDLDIHLSDGTLKTKVRHIETN